MMAQVMLAGNIKKMENLFPGGVRRTAPAEEEISQAIREVGPGPDQGGIRAGSGPDQGRTRAGWSGDGPGMVQGWSRDGPRTVPKP